MTKHPQTHTETPQEHPRQDFQIDRIAFFSDAVIAIAITLLVLDIKFPHFTKDSTYAMLMDQLGNLSYGITALVLTFIVISNYWVVHHLLFKHIHGYNRSIIWANMAFLLTIIFFPFTTSLFSESGDNMSAFQLALQLFFVNNVLALVALTVLYWLAFKTYREFTYTMSKIEEKQINNELFFPLIVFSILLITSFFTNNFKILLGLNFVIFLGKRVLTIVIKPKKKTA